MTKEEVLEIKNNPNYQKLVGTRSKFAWILTIIILIVYYAICAYLKLSH